MSKRAILILLNLVLTISTCALPAHAASATIVISAAHAGVTGGATQEFVIVHNNSADAIDMTDWCLKNKSAVAFYCFTPTQAGEQLWLDAYSSVPVVSEVFAALNPEREFLSVFTPTHQTSGSLVGSNDTVTLVNTEGTLQARMSWSTTATNGFYRQLPIVTVDPLAYDDAQLVEVTLIGELPADGIFTTITEEELPEETPESILPTLRITELLPNVEGSDDGKEFIELLNTGSEPVNTEGLLFELGVASLKRIALPAAIIEPGKYYYVSNDQLKFSLVNTTGQVKLLTAQGDVIDASYAYENPKDDMAWALIDGVWQYSNQPTPGALNLASLAAPLKPAAASVLKPCRSDQYRSPETNRCRKIAAATTKKPCNADQYRSPETGRCRKIATTATPTPCKEGWERNQETNRCRKIKAMTTADYGVLSAKSTDDEQGWYWVWAIAAAVLLAIGYAVWEWRDVLRRTLQKLFAVFRPSS